MTHILDGLPEEYDPVVMNVAAANQTDHVSVAYVHGLLLNMEMRIARHRSSTAGHSEQTNTALFTPKNGNTNNSGRNGGRFSNHGRGRGRGHNGHNGGRSSNNSNKNANSAGTSSTPTRGPPRISCQICNRVGHSAIDCYHRMDYAYQGRNPPSRLTAMVASNQLSGDQTWYTDIGATDHITSDINNLTLRSDYHGSEKVSVGNGASLSISHIGSGSISTHTAHFHLSNMLHVPHMSTNLISVNRFATDTNCVFEFDSSGFCIKDKATGKMLFCGRSESGLYPFPIHRISTHSNKASPTALIGEKVSASMWHSRLGHPASTILHRLLSTFQLPLHGSSKFTSVCTECQMGKSRKLPFLASTSFSSQPLDLVHCDLWGSSPELSVSGYNYYIYFIDDCTKYVWLYPLSAKSQAFVTFLKFKTYVENMLSLKLKSF